MTNPTTEEVFDVISIEDYICKYDTTQILWYNYATQQVAVDLYHS